MTRLATIPEEARALVGADAEAAGWLETALLYPNRPPGLRAGHLCTLGGDAVRWAKQLPAGGVVRCDECGWPYFIAPAEDLDDAPDAELELDLETGTRRFDAPPAEPEPEKPRCVFGCMPASAYERARHVPDCPTLRSSGRFTS